MNIIEEGPSQLRYPGEDREHFLWKDVKGTSCQWSSGRHWKSKFVTQMTTRTNIWQKPPDLWVVWIESFMWYRVVVSQRNVASQTFQKNNETSRTYKFIFIFDFFFPSNIRAKNVKRELVLKINTAYYHSCWLHPVVSGDGITKQIESAKNWPVRFIYT